MSLSGKKYTNELSDEISALSVENKRLRALVSDDILQLTKARDADTIIASVKKAFFLKLTGIALASALITALLLFTVLSFMTNIAVPLVSDGTERDSSFIPDSQTVNTVGSASAISHLGYEIVFQGDYCYYLLENNLYKTNGNTETVTADISAKYLNIYGNCLYYYDSENKTINRIRTDGKDPTVLTKKDGVSDIEVYNRTVYYLNDLGNLYSVYFNGKGEYTLKTGLGIEDFVVFNGTVFYTSKNKLYKMTTNGAEVSVVTEIDNPTIASDGKRVFYLYGGTLFAFDPKTEKAYAYFSGEITDFALMNGKLLVFADRTYIATNSGGRITVIDKPDTLSLIASASLYSND